MCVGADSRTQTGMSTGEMDCKTIAINATRPLGAERERERARSVVPAITCVQIMRSRVVLFSPSFAPKGAGCEASPPLDILMMSDSVLSKDSPQQDLMVPSLVLSLSRFFFLSFLFFFIPLLIVCQMARTGREHLCPQGKNFIASARKETGRKMRERKRTKEGCVLKEGI